MTRMEKDNKWIAATAKNGEEISLRYKVVETRNAFLRVRNNKNSKTGRYYELKSGFDRAVTALQNHLNPPSGKPVPGWIFYSRQK